jgi:hypothetical protein
MEVAKLETALELANKPIPKTLPKK